MNNTELLILGAVVILIFYYLQLNGSSLSDSSIEKAYLRNSTNIGFVKPEHRLLKIFNTISSGSKIKLDGICNRYIYNKNTIDSSVNDRLTAIMKELINTINHISQNDYYMKSIENVYGLISCNKNQRYFIG